METEVELFTIGLTKMSFQSMYAQVDGVKTSVWAQQKNKLYEHYSEQEKEGKVLCFHLLVSSAIGFMTDTPVSKAVVPAFSR